MNVAWIGSGRHPRPHAGVSGSLPMYTAPVTRAVFAGMSDVQWQEYLHARCKISDRRGLSWSVRPS